MDEHRGVAPLTPFDHDGQAAAPEPLQPITDWPALIADTIDEAVFCVDHSWCFTYINAQAEVRLGFTREQLLGRNVWEAFPRLIGSPFEQIYRDAMDQNRPQVLEDYSTTTQSWYAVRAYPIPAGVVGIFRDISVRKQAEVALRRSQEELEERVMARTAELENINRELQAARRQADLANQAKSEFLSRMSHELRTPLHGILGFGQVLESEDLTELQREGVHYILKSGRHLLGLINEILDIARVDAGRLEVSIEPVAVAEVVAEACSLVRHIALQHNISIVNEIRAEQALIARADRQQLKQVLLNLVSNAIKYNRSDGEVLIRAGLRPHQRLSIAVQDTGPGIAPEDVAKLFMPFERLHAASSAVEGSGLGLALAQRLATTMGGLISVETSPGQGSTFSVELPQATLQADPGPAEPAAVDSGPAASLAGHQTTVIYIEDNPANTRLIEVVLKRRPEIRLVTASDGRQGLNLLRQYTPDLVLMDLHLPDMPGQNILERLQSDESTRHIPVVVISADATHSQIERLLAAGARAYLTKPVNIAEFLALVDSILT